MNRIEEIQNLKTIKSQLRELKFQSVVNDIMSAIEQINYAETDKQVIKYNIEQYLYKSCESEEILNDNQQILDRESTNGLYKRKMKNDIYK